jgi:hypothetical protein
MAFTVYNLPLKFPLQKEELTLEVHERGLPVKNKKNIIRMLNLWLDMIFMLVVGI